MKSYLIADTTEEERRRIVEESLACSSGWCEECPDGMAVMYEAYIAGQRELSEINAAFRANVVKNMPGPERTGCDAGNGSY